MYSVYFDHPNDNLYPLFMQYNSLLESNYCLFITLTMICLPAFKLGSASMYIFYRTSVLAPKKQPAFYIGLQRC